MALGLSIEQSNVGIPFANAYAKIVSFQGNKDRLLYTVLIYATESARQANAKEVAYVVHECSTPQENIMQGLYSHLKQQVGFQNSVDV